jgi:predicted transposase YdaD
MSETPHDALFKQVFSQPARAAEELRHVLAPELAARIDFATLAVERGSFVDDDLRECHADLLFSASLAGTMIRIYVLFEHQSSVDPWMPLRLLKYMLRIWEAVRKAEPGAAKLPAIVPVVLHHSDTGWRAATEFAELLALPSDAPAQLLAHVPNFRFALDDLSGDEAIAARKSTAYTRLVLSALRDARRKALGELFHGWAALLREVSREIDAREREAREFWVYLYKVRGADEYATADRSALDPDQEATMQTIAEMLEEKGREKGRQEGLQQGKREFFLHLLGQRFGRVPESVARRVEAADVPALERWSIRILTARSLDEVFEP